MAKAQEIILTQSLTKLYGDTLAVDNLNLAVREGEVFGLLGPNGAGKTTTILMLLGLTEPTSGSAIIDGLDCTRQPISVKQFVGYLPDNTGFYSDMTGLENMLFTGRLNSLDKTLANARADVLLNRVGLAAEADKKVGAYSRGMRQRLAIADILMKDPKIIILDEPTLGIDPEGMRDLLSLIRDLSEKDGRTVLISSHQLHHIQQICDRVGIFVKGRLIACGKIGELLEQLGDDISTQIEVSVFNDNDKLQALLSDSDIIRSVSRENEMFIIYAQNDIRADLAEMLSQNGFKLAHLRLRSGDLDEIYRRYFEREEVPDGNEKRKRKS